jgi:hypothetical protein
MKTTVNLYDFRQAFADCGRADQFSYEGLEILFDYLEQYEEDTGEEIDLDVIALCCDYAEGTVDEIVDCYSIDLSECVGDADKLEVARNYVENESQFIGATDTTIIYAQF